MRLRIGKRTVLNDCGRAEVYSCTLRGTQRRKEKLCIKHDVRPYGKTTSARNYKFRLDFAFRRQHTATLLNKTSYPDQINAIPSNPL